MTSQTRTKLVLAGIGVLLWGYGARTDHLVSQWIGIGCLIGAFMLRFLPPSPE